MTLVADVEAGPAARYGRAGRGAAHSIGPLLIAASFVVVHWVTNATTVYGAHRDEMLYVAMGHHFALWRMDGPPAIAAIARLSTALLGSSVLALRVLPPIAGAGIIILTSGLARIVGGGVFAQLLAALSVACSPMFLGSSNLLQPVVFDQLWWTLVLYAVARLASADRMDAWQWWAVLGVAAGLGILAKFIIAVLFVALALSAIFAGAWRRIDWRGLAIAAGLAALIGSPSLVGQIRLGFPIFGQLAQLHASQLTHVSVADWLRQMAFLAPTSLLAVAGAVALLRAWRYRVVGLACVLAFAMILALHGKFYYAQPVFPTLWAAGAVLVERPGGRTSTWLRPITVVALVADGALLAPFALPVLPPPEMVRYTASLGVTARTDRGEVVPLPSDFGDMLGWPAQVAAVAAVYDRLPVAEQTQTVLFAQNYGEAAAIDFYGGRYGLPHALTNQGTYYLYGPGDRPGTTAIAIGIPRSFLTAHYASVTLAAHVDTPDAVPEEAHLEIYVCRDARQTMQSLWPQLAGRY